MINYIIKIAITTILIVAISEIAKRSSFAGALLASLPLVSVLAILWLYVDTKDVEKRSALCQRVSFGLSYLLWFCLLHYPCY